MITVLLYLDLNSPCETKSLAHWASKTKFHQPVCKIFLYILVQFLTLVAEAQLRKMIDVGGMLKNNIHVGTILEL